MSEPEVFIQVTSGYGGNTRQPYVAVQIGDRKPFQIAPEEARRVAGLLHECAEAADQDAFLIEWFQRRFELSIEQAATILLEFRHAREEHA